MTRRLAGFWWTIDTLGSSVKALAFWEHLLGADFAVARRFLRPTNDLGSQYPCDKSCPCQNGRRLEENRDGTFAGLCEDERCEPVVLRREDLLGHVVDRDALARAVVEALGGTVRPSETTPVHRWWSVGTYPSASGIDVPVILGTPMEPRHLRDGANELLAAGRAPFVVLVTREGAVDAESVARLRNERCAVVTLATFVGADEAGKLVTLRPVSPTIEAAIGSAPPVTMKANPATSPSPSAKPASVSNENVFHRKGEMWTLAFAGATIHAKDRKGLGYIATLLRTPEREFHSAELVRPIGAGDRTVPLGSAGEALDPSALAAFRTRLREVDEEIEEAVENQDLGRRTSLEGEREAIAREVSGAIGLGGRVRKDADDGNRIRKAVASAVNDAIESIRAHHEPLARHLKTSVRLGYFVSYAPEAKTEWVA